MHLARDLVAGDVLAGVRGELVGVGVAPGRAFTTAATRSPHRSSGTPTTTTSNTSGWLFNAFSTSSGKTFSPPVLMLTDPRPSKVIVPSASTIAMSPGSTQRLPPASAKTDAVFSGSL